MNNYRKKIKNDDFNYINNGFEPYVETNILIREEAEYLTRHYMDNFVEGQNSNIEGQSSNIFNDEKNTKNISKEIAGYIGSEIKDSFHNLTNTLIDTLPSKEVFSTFQNSMSSTISKLDQIADILKENTLNNKQNEQEIVDYNNQQNVSFVSSDDENQENDLLESFQKLLDLKIETSSSEVNDLIEELATTKSNFDKIIKNYENSLAEISNKQEELNSYLLDSHSTISKLNEDIAQSKENYLKVESEISKIYSTWTENNKLLGKLESLIYEIGTSKVGYNEDLNTLLDDIKEKTIDNQSSLNQINLEVESMKEKIESMNKNYESLAEIHDKNVELLNERINQNQQILYQYDEKFSELKEKDFQYVERFIGLETQVAKNREDIDNLRFKYDEVLRIENLIDTVLSSEIFQKSIEMKITNMIIENNNYIGDEFKNKLDNFTTNVISDIDDVRKNNDDLVISYQIVENKLLELSNTLNTLDHTAEIQSQLEYIESNYKSLYDKTAERIKSNLDLIDNQLKDLKIDENEIMNIINSSHELTTIIGDKILQVANEKLNNVEFDINSIQKRLENNIKEFNSTMLKNMVDEKIEFEASKIKNESLNMLYKELAIRDEKIDLNNEELLRNYETILESNKILNKLEELVIRQGEEFDGYRYDKNNSISSLVDKIAENKKKISEMSEIIKTNLEQFNFYDETNEINKSIKRGLEAWKLEFSSDMVQMVKGLVEEEIKKKNIIYQYENNENETNNENNEFNPFGSPFPSVEYENSFNQQTSASGNEFFVNRIKDILNRLENSEIQKSFTEKFNLNIKVDELQKQQEEKQQEQEVETKDDDLNWFYEKEYKEFVSKKKNKSGNN